MEHCVQCNLLRVRVSSGMCVFSDAIQALKQLLNGVNLPQQFSQAKRPPESHGVCMLGSESHMGYACRVVRVIWGMYVR